MKNSENLTGTNVTNNLTALKFFSIATAIQKNLCLASCSSHLFLERKELLEVPFRRFLRNQGLNIIKTSKGRGGHEKWSRSDLDRPITIQTHIDPVPEFIVKQILRHLEMSREDFFKVMRNDG